MRGGGGGGRTAEDRTANRREGAGNACTYDCGLRGVRGGGGQTAEDRTGNRKEETSEAC